MRMAHLFAPVAVAVALLSPPTDEADAGVPDAAAPLVCTACVYHDAAKAAVEIREFLDAIRERYGVAIEPNPAP